jgi:hypothetical protein
VIICHLHTLDIVYISILFKNVEATVEEEEEEEEESPQQHEGPEKIAATKKENLSVPQVNGADMTVSLDGLQSSIDPSTLFSCAYGNMQ